MQLAKQKDLHQRFIDSLMETEVSQYALALSYINR